MINTVPAVSIQTTKKLYCLFNPTLYLNAQPSGGMFSGAGTSSVGIFSPASAGVGTHAILYSYTDGFGCTGTAVFSATVSSCSGIEENTSNTNHYAVYPNPNNGSFAIKAGNNMALALLNDMGQLIRVIKLDEINSYSLSIYDLPAGVYFLSGQSNSQLTRQKVIVTK